MKDGRPEVRGHIQQVYGCARGLGNCLTLNGNAGRSRRQVHDSDRTRADDEPAHELVRHSIMLDELQEAMK